MFDFADVLLDVLKLNASDLHLTAGSPPMVREKGRLRALDYPVLSPQQTREIIYSILTNDQRKKLENEWQIDFAYSIPGKGRFRVNAYFQRASLGAAFRLIPNEMPALDELGLPPVLREFVKKPRGFVLVTGPTGSGKTTTLAAMLDVINKERDEVFMTFDDTIEFLHRHLNCFVFQSELGAVALCFALCM
jgi:twitching motility protein PilT